jgi:SAM-dependent methyltransferase
MNSNASVRSSAVLPVPPETAGMSGLRALADGALLPAGDGDARVIREAHRWYEHLIALWAPGMIEAAYDLGVFAMLASGPLTHAELAEKLQADPHATRVLLDGLSAYGLLERTWDTAGALIYVLPPAASECLLPDGLYSLAGKIGYDRRLAWSAWRNLADSVRSGTRDAGGSEQVNQISESEYEALVHGINFWAPPVVDILAAALEGFGWAAGKQTAMLDVGCGTGLYSQLLLRRFPFLSAVGLDVQRITPLSVRQSERLNVRSRFSPVVSDFQNDEWGEGFGLVLFANIFHLQTPESAQKLAQKAAMAVSDSGYVAIVDHIIDDDLDEQSTQNRFFRLFAVSMLATGGGDAYSISEYEKWLAVAGLRRVALLDTPMHRILLAARR